MTRITLLLILITTYLTAQELEYNDNFDRLTIKSDRIIEKICFRVSSGNKHIENEPTNTYNVRNKIYVINIKKIDKESNELVIYYINETVVFEY